MFLEFCFKVKVGSLVTSGIEVQQSVETNAFYRCNVCSCRRIRLQSATSTDAYEGELPQLVLLSACFEVDICQRIQLIEYDIDVITTNARAHNRDAFAVIGSCNCSELTAFHFTFYVLKVGSYECYAPRIAHENHLVCKVFWFQMQMKDTSVLIDNQF